VRYQNEQNGTDGSGCEGIEKAPAEDAKLHEYPSADEGADNSKNYVRDAAEAATARDFSGEPSGDQTDDDPAPESAGECDPKTARLVQRAHQKDGHSASMKLLAPNWLGIARSLAEWLLLGHAVDGAQAEDKVAAGDADYFAAGEKFGERI
jgi:hypothetical protein